MQNKFQNLNQTSKNVLYISDLPTNATESDLVMFFKDYRENILIISFLPVRNTEYGKSISAKVIFRDPQVANEARQATNLKKIKGKTVRVMWDELVSNLRNHSQSNIFVKNIPFDIKPREFYEIYLKFGDIISAKMPEDDEGNHLGYGYINYAEPSSAINAIQSTNGKEIWGSILDVKLFQKKSERFDQLGNGENLNANFAFNGIKTFSLFLKNFPNNFNEDNIKKICAEYGDVVNCKVFSDNLGRAYSIVSFTNEESCFNAKNALQERTFEDGSVLFVDILMNKMERKKMLANKIKDTNSKLNEQYKMCNLHIRNIPYHAKEEEMREAFERFGPIKSAKIETYLLITKVNNEYKQIPTSRGFGYVCYEDPECAKLAIEQMNLKYLPKYETWNRPLLVDYFMPKVERNTVVNRINENPNEKLGFGPGFTRGPTLNQDVVNPGLLMNFSQLNLNPGFTPPFNPMVQPNMSQGNFNQIYPNVNLGLNKKNYDRQDNMNYYNNPNLFKNNFNQPYRNFEINQTKKKTVNTTSISPNLSQNKSLNMNKKNEVDEIDYAYFNSLDDESAQRDYLGELIFKKIENHELSQNYQFSIDTIGKITGMVLGIEDINEVIDIYKDYNNLTARIKEGMELLTIQS
jgi:RNA recognition motif-containing protein